MEEHCRHLRKTARNPQRRPVMPFRGRPARADEGNADGSRATLKSNTAGSAAGKKKGRLAAPRGLHTGRKMSVAGPAAASAAALGARARLVDRQSAAAEV